MGKKNQFNGTVLSAKEVQGKARRYPILKGDTKTPSKGESVKYKIVHVFQEVKNGKGKYELHAQII